MDRSSFDHSLQLPLMEAFYTIQGEGAFSGKPAYFIRLGGCDVGCVWCDVKDSWDANKWPLTKIESIVEEAAIYQTRLAVITGGEPFMYNLEGLTEQLKKSGFQINVETSGAHPYSGQLDWTCLSPKKFKAPLPEWYELADELKIIIYNQSDFKWAEQYAAQMRPDCQLLLQPEWSRQDKMTPYIIEYVKQHPQWSISLQTHKYLDIP